MQNCVWDTTLNEHIQQNRIARITTIKNRYTFGQRMHENT